MSLSVWAPPIGMWPICIVCKDFKYLERKSPNLNTRANNKCNPLTGRWRWRWRGALHLAAAGLVRLDGWGRAPLSLERTKQQRNQQDSEGVKTICSWTGEMWLEMCWSGLQILFGMAVSLKEEIKWISSTLSWRRLFYILLFIFRAGLAYNPAKALRIISGSNSQTQRSSATPASSMKESKGQTQSQRCIRTLGNPRPITVRSRDS